MRACHWRARAVLVNGVMKTKPLESPPACSSSSASSSSPVSVAKRPLKSSSASLTRPTFFLSINDSKLKQSNIKDFFHKSVLSSSFTKMESTKTSTDADPIPPCGSAYIRDFVIKIDEDPTDSPMEPDIDLRTGSLNDTPVETYHDPAMHPASELCIGSPNDTTTVTANDSPMDPVHDSLLGSVSKSPVESANDSPTAPLEPGAARCSSIEPLRNSALQDSPFDVNCLLGAGRVSPVNETSNSSDDSSDGGGVVAPKGPTTSKFPTYAQVAAKTTTAPVSPSEKYSNYSSGPKFSKAAAAFPPHQTNRNDDGSTRPKIPNSPSASTSSAPTSSAPLPSAPPRSALSPSAPSPSKRHRSIDLSPPIEQVVSSDSDMKFSAPPVRDCSDDENDAAIPPKSFGVALDSLRRSPRDAAPLPELRPQRGRHDVLFRPHIRSCEPPRPFPNQYADAWDPNHVRMPCSPKNMCPTDGGSRVMPRWKLIQDSLDPTGQHHAISANDDGGPGGGPFILSSSFDLEEAILRYNPHYANKWDFRTLHSYFHEALGVEEAKYFFSDLLPRMTRLCLSLPDLVTSPPPLLRKLRAEGSRRLTLSRLQVSALLANAFFCTFPRRNAQNRTSEFASFPEINFNRLFANAGNPANKHEKLKALLHYFDRVTQRQPLGTISFTRQKITASPLWRKSTKTLPRLRVSAEGTIEDADGLTQVDFANKYLGGGTLGSGCVQEEIRFLMCPELILSQLVAEELDPTECLIMIGAERYSNYSGYASTFQWRGKFIDRTRSDSWGRKCVEVVAMDALRFPVSIKQYSWKNVLRELNKAYCAFCRLEPGHIVGDGEESNCANSPGHKTGLHAVATGNWGCGAFGGDPYLKTLIQLMAAAETGRDMAYFTFGDIQLARDIYDMHSHLTETGVTVGDLCRFLHIVDKRATASRNSDKRTPTGKKLFAFFMEWLSGNDDDDEDEEEVVQVVEDVLIEDDEIVEMNDDIVEDADVVEVEGDDVVEVEDAEVERRSRRRESEEPDAARRREGARSENGEGSPMAATSASSKLLIESPDLFTDDDDDDDDIPDFELRRVGNEKEAENRDFSDFSCGRDSQDLVTQRTEVNPDSEIAEGADGLERDIPETPNAVE